MDRTCESWRRNMVWLSDGLVMEKQCKCCRKTFGRPAKRPQSLWLRQRFCSTSCAATFSNRGRVVSEKTRRLLRAKSLASGPWSEERKMAHRNRPVTWLGWHHSEATRELLSLQKRGSKAPKWKGGVTLARNYKRFTKKQYLARKVLAEGSHTVAEWNELKLKHNLKCLWCKKTEPHIKLTEDHITPLSKGGSDSIANIQPLCGSCNSKKATKAMDFSRKITYFVCTT